MARATNPHYACFSPAFSAHPSSLEHAREACKSSTRSFGVHYYVKLHLCNFLVPLHRNCYSLKVHSGQFPRIVLPLSHVIHHFSSSNGHPQTPTHLYYNFPAIFPSFSRIQVEQTFIFLHQKFVLTFISHRYPYVDQKRADLSP